MVKRKNYFMLTLLFGLVLLPVLLLMPQLFTERRDVKGSVDFFEMSLEQLMTIEVALADEPDVNRMDFFEMPLEQLMTIEVG